MSICRPHQMIHFLIYINRNSSQTNRALRNCIKWHGTKPELSPIIEWNRGAVEDRAKKRSAFNISAQNSNLF